MQSMTSWLRIGCLITSLLQAQYSLAQGCADMKEHEEKGDRFLREKNYKQARTEYSDALNFAQECHLQPFQISHKLDSINKILEAADSAYNALQEAGRKAKDSMIRHLDSISREYAAEKLATASRNQNYSLAKRSLILLACDTLAPYSKGTVNDQLHGAMIDFLLTTLWHRILILSDEMEEEEVLEAFGNSDGSYPHVNTANPDKPIWTQRTTLALHTWRSNSRKKRAILLSNRSSHAKLLRIYEKYNPDPIRLQPIGPDEDIPALLFTPDDSSILYATHQHHQKGSLYTMSMTPGALPQRLMSFQPGEYLILTDAAHKTRMAITNFGRILRWINDDWNNPILDTQTSVGEYPITTALFAATQNCLYTGRENGEIWEIDTLGHQRVFFSGESSRVMKLALSKNQRKLATAFYSGAIVLWDLSKPNPAPEYLPACRILAQNEFDDISTLYFSDNSEALIAATKSGLVFEFPLDIESLAKKIKDNFQHLKPEEWNKYIPNIKYQDL